MNTKCIDKEVVFEALRLTQGKFLDLKDNQEYIVKFAVAIRDWLGGMTVIPVDGTELEISRGLTVEGNVVQRIAHNQYREIINIDRIPDNAEYLRILIEKKIDPDAVVDVRQIH